MHVLDSQEHVSRLTKLGTHSRNNGLMKSLI